MTRTEWGGSIDWGDVLQLPDPQGVRTYIDCVMVQLLRTPTAEEDFQDIPRSIAKHFTIERGRWRPLGGNYGWSDDDDRQLLVTTNLNIKW